MLPDHSAPKAASAWLTEAVVRECFSVTSAQPPREVVAAFQAFVSRDGSASLDRCFGLPDTKGHRRKLLRDAYLRTAHAELQITTPGAGSAELHEQMKRFVARGVWHRWRDMRQAPADASRLYQALHAALRLNDGRALSARQIRNVLCKK